MSKNPFFNSIQYLRKQIINARGISQSLDYELRREMREEEGYLFSNAKELASLMLRILEALELNLELEYHGSLAEIIEQTQSGSANLEEELRRINQRVNETVQISAGLTPLLKYVDGARAAANPWGIVTQMDRLCRSLNPRARVIIRPRWQYNYTYYPISHVLWMISNYSNAADSRVNTALTRLLAEAPYYFSLAFPPTTNPDILQMAIWSHELGHFIDNFEGMKTFNTAIPVGDKINYVSQELASRIRPNIPPEVVSKIIEAAGYSEKAEIVEILENINKPIGQLAFRWARELFADLFSVHLFGPAAIFSLVEFVQPLTGGALKSVDSEYPPLNVRLNMMLREYDKWSSNGKDTEKSGSLDTLEEEIRRLKELDAATPDASFLDDTGPLPRSKYFDVIYPYMIEYLNSVATEFGNYISKLELDSPDCYMKPEDLHQVSEAVSDLEQGMPPDLIRDRFDPGVPGIRKRLLALVINSGWLYWLKKQRSPLDKSGDFSQYSLLQQDFQKVNQLLLKAVEENETEQWFSDQGRFTESDPDERVNADKALAIQILDESNYPIVHSGILRRRDVLVEMQRRNYIIRPLLSPATQIHETCIDLRLGNEFIVMKRSALTKLDPIEIQKNPGFMDNQSKYYVPFGTPFVLHPWQFILASSLEYVKLPEACLGWIANPKWWTKLGLMYVGSQDIDPGFKGVVSFELTNLGNAPILLYPGSRICRLYLLPISQTSPDHKE